MPIKDLIKSCKEYGMKSVAMTDHGTMLGMVKFCSEAAAHGIKPIIGCEVNVARKDNACLNEAPDQEPFHLTLLVKNQTGHKNLVKLVSSAYAGAKCNQPYVSKQHIEEYSEGLIALSGCLKGEIPRLILSGKHKATCDAARWYESTFGAGNFYFEIMDHELNEQRIVNIVLVELSRELSIPLVATNNVHYLKAEDAFARNVMNCIRDGKTPNSGYRWRGQFFFKTPEQMCALFSDHPEAITATTEIADKCNFELETGKLYLPDFEVPQDHSANSYLDELTREGLKRKFHPVTADITERADFELKTIKNMGCSEYFLIVWDLLRYARSENIPVGPGRGSVAGSLVAFALDITKVDPLKYGLIFERFLNPTCVCMPDIDMDFCDGRREHVIEYARQKYGVEKVSMIATFQQLKARAAIRDIGRVLGLGSYADRIASCFPSNIPDKKLSIENIFEDFPELLKIYDKFSRLIIDIIDVSRKIVGRSRNVSTNAAGIVISRNNLTDHVPIFTSTSLKGAIVTQADKDDLEALGLLKMDFLELRVLSLIDDAIELIKENSGTQLYIDNIPLDDKRTYKLFADGDTDGIWQFEADTMKILCARSNPTCIEDLAALNVLNRPGPIRVGMDETFTVNRHLHPEGIDYLHPMVEPILRDTFGVILYQEQIMQIAKTIGGFSLVESDNLRRAIGKKKFAEMEKMEKNFIENATGIIHDKGLAEIIFDNILEFAGYAFNMSHSVSYALISYQTAYLKANFPVEFMAALLTSVNDDYQKTERYIDECRRMNINIYPSNKENLKITFRPEGDKIKCGIDAPNLISQRWE